MADVNILLGNKDGAWFSANPTIILLQGQHVDLLGTGLYKLGNGVTELQSLPFLGNMTTIQDGLQSGGEITVVGDDITVAPASWLISPNVYATLVDTDFLNIPYSALGNQRYIGFYGTTSNTIVKVEGSEATIASYPTQPANTIIIGFVLVGDANIGVLPDLSGYEEKVNKATTMIGNESSNVFYLTAKSIYDWATGFFVKKGSITNNKILKGSGTDTATDSTLTDNLGNIVGTGSGSGNDFSIGISNGHISSQGDFKVGSRDFGSNFGFHIYGNSDTRYHWHHSNGSSAFFGYFGGGELHFGNSAQTNISVYNPNVFRIGINSSLTNIENSSALQIESTTQGFLPPRQTTSEKNAISSPVKGLIVVDKTIDKLCLYISSWKNLATEDYVDGLVAGLLDDRGSYDASSNLYPSTGGSGTAGAILKGDIWYISVAGVLGGVAVTIGDSVRAITDTPGQTSTNWSILETNIGYVPENITNKTGTVTGNEASTTLYAHIKGLVDWAKQGLTGVLPTKTTPVDADSVLINDSADSNKTKLTTWANLKATLKTYFDSLYSTTATQPIQNNFRLTLTSGVPVTTGDVVNAQTIYCTPYNGNKISLYDGTKWVTYSSSEISLALGSLTTGNYDVYCYANAGVPTLEFLAWTNDTTRATSLTMQDGVLVKSGDATRKYLGTFSNAGNKSSTVTITNASPAVITYTGHGLTANAPVVFTTNGVLPSGIIAGNTYYVASLGTATANTFNISATPGGALINTTTAGSGTHTCTVGTYTEDSKANRYLYNFYNQASRLITVTENTATWNYTTATFRQVNANKLNQANFVLGVGSLISSRYKCRSYNTTIGVGMLTAFGLDNENELTGSRLYAVQKVAGSAYAENTNNIFDIDVSEGKHFIVPLEFSTASGTTTWVSTPGSGILTSYILN